MHGISRRGLLTGAVATGAALLDPLGGRSPARAAAPAAGKQAAGWYRYKVGSIEVTAVTDGARTFPLPDTFVKNAPKDAVSACNRRRLRGEGQGVGTVHACRREYRRQAGRDRYRQRTGSIRGDQGCRRPVPHQSRRRGHRPGHGRYGDPLALPRRSHQRPAHGRQQGSVPERGDDGAGDRMEVLVGRRRNEQGGCGQPAGRQLQEHPQGVRRAGQQGDAIRRGQGARIRHHLGCDPWTHAGSYVAHRRLGRCQGAGAGRRHRSRRGVVCAQPRLACRVRYGRCHGRGDAAQDLRHGCHR